MNYEPCLICEKRIPTMLLSDGKCPRCLAASPPPVLPPRPCFHCGKLFQPTRAWGKFCSTKCSLAFHHASNRELLEKAALMVMERDVQIAELKQERDALIVENALLRRGLLA